jgi:PTH1 family peptidyl-tRNA hydrolase
VAPRLIVGLGNPGPAYQGTRHNLGFEVLDILAAAEGIRFQPDRLGPVEIARWGDARLLKPLTFMNLSGTAIRSWLQWLKWETADVLVIVDDTALPLGQLRLRTEGSSGGHNGLRSIEAELGTARYARLRGGVGPLPPGWKLEDYVLGKFNHEERPAYQQMLQAAAEAVRSCQSHGIASTMNLFNGRRGDSSTDKIL